MEHNAAAVIAVVHVCVVLVAAVDSVEAAKIAFHQPSVAPCPDRKTSLVRQQPATSPPETCS